MDNEMSQHAKEHATAAFSRLTERQKEIYACYSRLGSASKVAIELGLSTDHAKKTLSHVRRALGVEPSNGHATRKRQPTGKAALLLALVEKQQHKCALSGVALTPDVAVIDHKIPIANGGTNEIDNLQWLHRDVNRMKGSMNQEAFIALCLAIASKATVAA